VVHTALGTGTILIVSPRGRCLPLFVFVYFIDTSIIRSYCNNSTDESIDFRRVASREVNDAYFYSGRRNL